MRALVLAIVMLITCTWQADAGCGFLGLFPCRFHHYRHHRVHRPHVVVVHKTVTTHKTIVVYRHVAKSLGLIQPIK